MFLIPVDSVIGFSTAAPTAILTRLFQLWDYSSQQVEDWLFAPVNCWLKNGQVNYTTPVVRSGEVGPAHVYFASKFRCSSYQQKKKWEYLLCVSSTCFIWDVSLTRSWSWLQDILVVVLPLFTWLAIDFLSIIFWVNMSICCRITSSSFRDSFNVSGLIKSYSAENHSVPMLTK